MNSISNLFRQRLMPVIVLAVLTFAAARAQADEVLTLDIPAQDAGSALLMLAKSSNLQIMLPDGSGANVEVEGLKGKYRLEEALAVLLTDTGLAYEFTSENVVVVQEAEQGSEPKDSDEAPAENDEEPIELPEQTVTGSRLQTTPAASPVYVLSRAEIDRRGLKNIEDIVRYLPQNFPTILSGGSFDSRSPRFSQGAVTINLRGLGEGSTLVLVNGKRIAATPAERGTFTDISTIPFNAIERVEMLTDGASAIYGSDAVGGVVNFILKQNYRGAESSLRYESSSSGGDLRVFEQTFGISWDTGNVTASFNYQEEDPVDAGKARIDTDTDYREQGGRFFPAIHAQPGILLSYGPFPSGAPWNTSHAILPPGDGTNIDSHNIVYVSHAEWLTHTGNFNLFPAGQSPLATGDATPATEHLAAYLNVSQQLGERLVLDFRGTLGKQDVVGTSNGVSFDGTVPTSNYYNTLQSPVYVSYSFQREIADGLLDPHARVTESERLNLSALLTWDIPVRNWQAILSLGYGENQYYNGSNGWFYDRSAAFLEALASSDPAKAVNPFGDGSVQPSNLRAFQEYRSEGSRASEQQVAGLSFSGALLELPGGGIELALGGELRTDSLDFENFQWNPFFRSPILPDVVPESDSTSWFAELSVPLVGQSNARTGLHSLSLHIAGRYDDYEIQGPFGGPFAPESKSKFDDFVSKFGVAYYPAADLKLRATWGEAFQAPTLPELFLPSLFFNPPHTPPFFAIFDPFNPAGNGGVFTPVFPLVVFGGNPDLKPQTSDTLTFGFEFNPNQWPGVYLSATWNKTKFQGLIGNLQSALGSPPLFALEYPEKFPGLVERDARGILSLLSYRSANLAALRSEAVDIEARYRFDTAMGEFVAGIFATRTVALETTPAVGVDPVKQEGTDQGPVRLKGNAYLDWSYGKWTVNLTINHEDGYRNTDPEAVTTSVDSHTTVDVQGTYALPASGWRISLGVQNAFDADFPFFDSRYGVDSAHVDFRRRIVFLDIVREFSW